MSSRWAGDLLKYISCLPTAQEQAADKVNSVTVANLVSHDWLSVKRPLAEALTTTSRQSLASLWSSSFVHRISVIAGLMIDI